MPWILPEGLDTASCARVCYEPRIQPGLTERRLLVCGLAKAQTPEQSYSGKSTTSPYFIPAKIGLGHDVRIL